MPRLKIPTEFQGGITKLLSLPADHFEALVAALNRVPYKLYQVELVAELEALVQEIQPVDLKEIVRSVWSMESVRSGAEAALDQFLPDLLESIESLRLRPDFLNQSDAAQRLEVVLKIPSLSVASKARTLLQEGHSFCRARLLTDIRAVFEDIHGAPGAPVAAVIVHNLLIGYHDGSVRRELVVSMDGDDLDQLSEIIGRAKSKQERLEALLGNTNIVYLKAD